MRATPALADISDITVAAQNKKSFGKPITHVLANDPGFGTGAPFQYILTSTMAHQVSASYGSSSDTSNYIRWYVRDTNGSTQKACQVRGDKGMNIHGNLYLSGLLYRTTASSREQSLSTELELEVPRQQWRSMWATVLAYEKRATAGTARRSQ